MKSASSKPWWSLALIGLWMGCDAQAGEPYRGEPLLTMWGSVELALEVENEDALVPTLAFRGDNDTLYLAEADVEGAFPAEFTLNVYEPPPEGALVSLGDYHEPRPRLALGYIAAVRPETPDVFQFTTGSSSSNECWWDVATQLQACEEIHRWCNRDETACYTEVVFCPDSIGHPDDCTVEVEGDPMLKLGLYESFAGLSENYIVVWLDEPAAPYSYIAYALGEREEGLAQGYHLFSVTDASEEQKEAEEVCMAQVRALSTDRTNQRFGTSYTQQELSSLCEEEQPCEHEELYAAHRKAEYAAEIELDCPSDDNVITRVASPAQERISVRIGPDLDVL